MSQLSFSSSLTTPFAKTSSSPTRWKAFIPSPSSSPVPFVPLFARSVGCQSSRSSLPPDTILFSSLLPGRSTLARRLPPLLPLPLRKLRVDLEVPRRKVLLPELALALLEARVEVGGNDEREKGVDVKGGEGAFERELGGRNKGGSGGREKEVGRRKA